MLFWLQFLCHRIFEDAVYAGDFRVTDVRVHDVFSNILNDAGCKPQFYLLYQEAEHDMDAFELLKLIAAGACNEGCAVRLTSLFPDQDNMRKIGKALKKLVDVQIITIEDAAEAPSVRFQVEALRAFLRKNLLTL